MLNANLKKTIESTVKARLKFCDTKDDIQFYIDAAEKKQKRAIVGGNTYKMNQYKIELLEKAKNAL